MAGEAVLGRVLLGPCFDVHQAATFSGGVRNNFYLDFLLYLQRVVIRPPQAHPQAMYAGLNTVRELVEIAPVPGCQVLGCIVVRIEIDVVVTAVDLAMVIALGGMTGITMLHGVVVVVLTRVVQGEIIQQQLQRYQFAGGKLLAVGRRLYMHGGLIAVVVAFLGLCHQYRVQAHLIAGTVAPLDVFWCLLNAVDNILVGLGIVPGAFKLDSVTGLHQQLALEAIGTLPVEIPVADIEHHLFGAILAQQR